MLAMTNRSPSPWDHFPRKSDIRGKRDSRSSTKEIGFQIINHVLKRRVRQDISRGNTVPGNEQLMRLAVDTDQIAVPIETISLTFSENAWTFSTLCDGSRLSGQTFDRNAVA
jgi:hypothetical protein